MAGWLRAADWGEGGGGGRGKNAQREGLLRGRKSQAVDEAQGREGLTGMGGAQVANGEVVVVSADAGKRPGQLTHTHTHSHTHTHTHCETARLVVLTRGCCAR
eukprot:1702851-Rhodomonas_salina.1